MDGLGDGQGHHWYSFSLCSQRLKKKRRESKPPESCKRCLRTTGTEMAEQCTLRAETGIGGANCASICAMKDILP